MPLREARLEDIPAMQKIRHLVKENILTDPALVTDHDVADYLANRGKGFVFESEGSVAGFGIVDLSGNSIWALFIHPAHERKGIGKCILNAMLSWYFDVTMNTVWLTTAPGTRAESFYRKGGWVEKGKKPNGEIYFEKTYAEYSAEKK